VITKIRSPLLILLYYYNKKCIIELILSEYYLQQVKEILKKILSGAAAFLLLFSAVNGNTRLSEDYSWLSLLHDEPEEYAAESIYSKGDVLYCTGDNPAASANNKAADLMMEGDYNEAEKILFLALKRAPLFFPFRYNIGICYLYLNRLDHALIHLNKAEQIVPEYYKVNLQIGYIYSRMNRESLAIDNFRIALRKNPRDLNILILMGDLYFERGQLANAQEYYRAALRINRIFPNGLLGLAKIHFINEDYIRAIVLLKSIDLSGDYDRALHYYYAESSFKTMDYEKAVEQYEELLKYKQDRFFLTNSILLINHKLGLARQFVDR
jgi:tetratricopeptide (TPR) repeat protein